MQMLEMLLHFKFQFSELFHRTSQRLPLSGELSKIFDF